MRKKPVPIIECNQEIPCNPCVTSCKSGAITKESLTALPVLDKTKCVGCKICAAACPGQAIYLLINDVEEGSSAISFPYEYLPLPQVGQSVKAVNRMGEYVCDAKVLEVDGKAIYNKTTLITILVPDEYRDEARFIERL